MADENKRLEESKEVTKQVQDAKDNYVQKEDNKVNKEAVNIVNLVADVISVLDKKDKDEAIKAIENILGKLEVLIAKDPKLKLIPINVQEQVVDYPGTLSDIEVTKDTVISLIEEGEVQKARDIMLNLASEIDIYVSSLPVLTYPDAIKAIIPLIDEEKFEEAKEVIYKVLDTIVLEKIVLPLPILRAEQAVIAASKLTKDKDNQEDKDKLKELLAYAKEQLVIAQALGYGNVNEDYKTLSQEIEKIEKILSGDESTKDIFETLKSKLSTFMSTFNKPKEPTKMPRKEDK